MLVLGTAGHIDHGKSAIVRRLTGTDPDRLPEEKDRGMTIDLGFAFREVEGGERIAFVDVPGHERFVKNMIAGAGGIDAVMLVVAADDGWMPQSQEHFQIVRLLGIRSGLIVINKCDLVEPDWLELLEADIREKVAGSFLQDAPIFKVSAQTGDGFDPLAAYLDTLPSKTAEDRDIGKSRLYIDRSFVLLGIGGVVTGTLRGGSLEVGQTVAVWPSKEVGKVRSLRANHREVQKALPGQRTAAAFTGIEKENLVRGGGVTDRLDFEFFDRHPVLALSVEMLPEAPVTLTDRRRVLFISGTTVSEGEIRLYSRRSIKPSESGTVFFKPDRPVYNLIGDRYIVRLPTPMITLGGGSVLDHLERLPRRKDKESLAYLEERSGKSAEDLVASELQKRIIAPISGLLDEAAVARSRVEKALKSLEADGVIGSFKGHVFHKDSLEASLEKFQGQVSAYLEENPHLRGLPRDQLLGLSRLETKTAEILLEYLIQQGMVVRVGDKYNLVGRGMSLKGGVKVAHDQIMRQLQEAPFNPPKLAKLAEGGKNHREAIKFIIDSGEGYKCGSDFVFLSETWEEIIGFIKERLGETGQMNVADLKDRFSLTRKFAIPILENTDRLKITRREGDLRVKGDRFEDQDSGI